MNRSYLFETVDPLIMRQIIHRFGDLFHFVPATTIAAKLRKPMKRFHELAEMPDGFKIGEILQVAALKIIGPSAS